MSEASKDTLDGEVTDDYIERLKRKYLKKYDVSAGEVSPNTAVSSEVESFSDMPANPSLTESERRHYNRAMKELGRALKLSENQLKSSLQEYEKSMKSSNDPSENADGSEATKITQNSSPTSTKSNPPKRRDAKASLPTSSIQTAMLPSTIALEPEDISRTKRTMTISTSLEDPALFWDDESTTLTGVSRRFLSNPNSEKPVSLIDIKAIYMELMGIFGKLHDEKRKIFERKCIEEKLEANFDARENELAIREAFLLEKERDLLERERAVSFAMQNMKKTKEITAKLQGVELEVQEKMELLQQRHQLEIKKMDSLLSTQAQEAKRMKSSFQVIKEQNDELRGKVDSLTEECKKSKLQNVKLKKRFENLQRKHEFQSHKPDKVLETSKSNKENVAVKPPSASSKPVEKDSKNLSVMLDTLDVLVNWIKESVFKSNNLMQKSEMGKKTVGLSDEFITDKCLKILPLFVDIMKASASHPSLRKHQLSYLSFIFLCLRRVDESQHSVLSSTTRRLGDELYKPTLSSSNALKSSGASLILATTAAYSVMDSLEDIAQTMQFNSEKSCQNLYFRCNNPEVRMLSCFIILKTLHQVDILAHVFGQLKKDLKDDVNRKLFVAYNAVHVIMPYITYRANKALLSDAVDVILQMSMESTLLPGFLEQCSNEDWFRAFSSAIRDIASSIDKPSYNPGILEKISVILQKLSKMKSNRKFFDAFSIGRTLQECYRCRDPSNTFLTLNLRSILFNLDLLKDS